MQFDDVEAYLAVVRSGSISKAAEQLYITQPTLTYRIQSLEKALGYQLFERSRGQRKINSSPQGREFYVIAEKMERLWKEGRAISKPRLSFRVATTYALNYYIMPTVCSSFWSRGFPISMEMRAMHYNECYAGIENGSIDTAVLTRSISSSLIPTPVWEDKMVLVCSSKAEYSGEVHPAELDNEKCIYIYWSPEYSKWHDYWIGVRNYQIRSDNIRLAENILAANPEYWSIAPLPIVKCIEKYRDLKHVAISGNPPVWPVFLLSKDPSSEYNRCLTEDIRTFISNVLENSTCPESINSQKLRRKT